MAPNSSDQANGRPQDSYQRSSSSHTQTQTDRDTSSEDAPGSTDTSYTSTNTSSATISEPDPRSSNADRQAMAIAQTSQGALHNPHELPRVEGEWHWLEQADHRRAEALGYEDPIDVTLARSRNDIGNGVDGDTPNVIFVPNAAHLNPEEQPEGEGSWSYLTVGADGSTRTWAWTQLGGQEEYGFRDIPHPTAQQVWGLRQRMIAEGRDISVLDGIDLTWVTNLRPHNTSARDTDENLSNSRCVPNHGENIDNEVFDQDPPHHPHDLTNGGERNQTGAKDLHWYRTIEMGGQLYTCDVSTAIINRPEPHKCNIPNDKGNWKRYSHADTMDWTNKDHLKALNAWRDQALARGGWPKKREDTREVYTEAQKRWVFDMVSDNQGKPPGSEALKKIAVEFNIRYEAKRTPAAISALCARLSKMYRDNGGKFVPGPKRGQVKKEEAARKRKERESGGEEKAAPKRRRKTVEEGEEKDEKAVARESGDEAGGGESEGEGP